MGNIGAWREESGARPKPAPASTFRSFGFLLLMMAEGHGGDSRERTEHRDGKPQVTKELVLMGPRGAARAFHGTVLGNGAHKAFLWAA